MNIWIEIKYLKGQTLRTLDQRKPFVIVNITETNLIVRPLSTGMDRPMARTGIEEP